MQLVIHDLKEENIPFNFDKDTIVISDNKTIKSCMGCFGCWTKTPGACIISDAYKNMGELLSKCDKLIIISECCYGGYSPFVKNVLDRSISYIHPYFAIRNKEMHHKRRYKNHFTVKTYFYGEGLTLREMETAKSLVKANAINYDCKQYEISFSRDMKELGGKLNEDLSHEW